ncbi:ribosome biogenesis ATPase [Raphidocelis subcapitata]|uniref:Ribosome biogenesis ATPase n=1 Tax=Raphidocelis subcapitata TaxID=307507 RepID=A0A2V0P0Z6_9CHLO|nr:ribosome biogenesis ATPase [Raphidocelis subcapitata]|eukprot:GBF93534.1 ribosome biogenesis ATPase [Raphidocelis subcapitata]
MGRNSGPGLTVAQLDRNLVPRLEQYALNGDLNDVEAVVDHLRRSYKEYQRRQIGALRQMVLRAIQIVQRKGPVGKPELVLEDKPPSAAPKQKRSAKKGSDDGSGSGGSDSETSGSDSDDGGGGEAAARRAAGAHQGMNNSLLAMYGAAPPGATASGAGGEGSDGAQSSSSGSGSGGGGSGGGGSDTDDDAVDGKPAFAPLEAVAAAAKRALAAERAAREAAQQPGGVQGAQQQQQQQTQTQQTQQQQEAADGPSTSGRPSGAPAAKPAPQAPAEAGPSAGAAAAAAAAGGKKSRGADDAGLRPRDRCAAAPREAAKKARRSAGTAGGGGGGGFAGGGRARGGSMVATPRPLRYCDLGGIEEVLADIRETIEYPLKHPEVYAWLGVEPPRGVLLHGPPGCGKTALAHAIANECGVPFLRVSAPEVVSGMSGESEAKLRQLFQEAVDTAPCIVFIDEIDAIAPKRETAQREMERRIVAQMLTCMDDLTAPLVADPDAPHLAATAAAASDAAAGGDGAPAQHHPVRIAARPHVVVIGATNRPDALDPALRRAGRFDREISLGIPTESAREQMLRVLTRPLRLQGGFDHAAVARRTPGFVGADLAALAKEAAASAVTRIFRDLDAAAAGEAAAAAAASEAAAAAVLQQQGEGEQQQHAQQQQAQQQQGAQPPPPAPPGRLGGGALTAVELGGLAITMADFEVALPKVQPSVRREGFTTKPGVTWDDVGSLEEVREELSFAISQPISNPERFAAMGLAAATGVLLYGPPGCGKTLVAKAVANESGANFISIKGPELLNKYVGESERAVRQLFARARAAHPCVLFFDELDALAPRRGNDTNQAAERVVNQLLTEMDGIDGREGVYLIAATNRPDMIDPALLRPGRLDKVLFVPLPPPPGRASILRAAARKAPLGGGALEAAEALVRSARCEGYSGADVAALVREASVVALKEALASGAEAAPVEGRHFDAAAARVQPSVSRKDQRVYEALRSKLRAARGHLVGAGSAAASGGGEGDGGGGGGEAQPEASDGARPMDTAGGGGAGGGAGVGGGADGGEPMHE